MLAVISRIGHSRQVAEKRYLEVTPEHFHRAVNEVLQQRSSKASQTAVNGESVDDISLEMPTGQNHNVVMDCRKSAAKPTFLKL